MAAFTAPTKTAQAGAWSAGLGREDAKSAGPVSGRLIPLAGYQTADSSYW